ncbi:TB2/DP1, HVA22 family-domain-containing protein [Daldinia caldariorum]|uniref:TB2/DP1, HVA22 family-domain-containing protein n=1 Tax=Daldinia caldariorum TaxID=326644 RepID=UPI0020080480|nr:TB2/DP1, HVA22 family-domain-containing protein [Daldinia caldariorum]KAI1472725.1 TB2/DP1, HVA22 family-domain-containing protein [Daldinia caldariorum]
MFDLIPKLLSSIASFLFPLFASYKALKTSDPTQLTPWLMYWSVLSCALLVESWLEFILWWVPFYSYMRLFFLLYLVLPQTQGARVLYETYLHPYLEENEAAIEDFIASSHDRLKSAGIAYIKRAIDLLRTQVLGMPPQEPEPEETRAAAAAAPQGYTQALLARFSVPAARWASNNTGTAGHDFFNLLANAVGGPSAAAAAASGSRTPGGSAIPAKADPMISAASLIPGTFGGAEEKMTFIAAQREKLALMMGALDREARQLQISEEERKRTGSMNLDGQEGGAISRPPSGHSVWSGLSKSRSEVDFEKIDAESGAEDDNNLRRRAPATGAEENPAGKHGWSFLGWGTVGTGTGEQTNQPETGRSSGVQK